MRARTLSASRRKVADARRGGGRRRTGGRILRKGQLRASQMVLARRDRQEVLGPRAGAQSADLTFRDDAATSEATIREDGRRAPRDAATPTPTAGTRLHSGGQAGFRLDDPAALPEVLLADLFRGEATRRSRWKRVGRSMGHAELRLSGAPSSRAPPRGRSSSVALFSRPRHGTCRKVGGPAVRGPGAPSGASGSLL